jgi:hypothetical protein
MMDRKKLLFRRLVKERMKRTLGLAKKKKNG